MQPDRLVFAEHFARSDPEDERITNLAGRAGDSDFYGRIHMTSYPQITQIRTDFFSEVESAKICEICGSYSSGFLQQFTNQAHSFLFRPAGAQLRDRALHSACPISGNSGTWHVEPILPRE